MSIIRWLFLLCVFYILDHSATFNGTLDDDDDDDDGDDDDDDDDEDKRSQ